MGQVCFASEENEQRITELESLLKEQETEKATLKQKLEKERERQKRLKSDKYTDDEADSSNEKIETLKNEKKTVFKQMLKEKKNVSKLEDSIQDYKSQIAEMEKQIKDLKYEKKKAQQRINNGGGGGGLAPSNRPTIAGSSSKSNSTSTKSSPFQSTLAGITIPTVPDTSSYKPRGKRHTDDNVTDSEMGGDTTTDYSEEEPELEQKTTEILDISYDPPSEATHVYSWLHGPG